ncbi:MAG: 50S ribosomal protein L29 [Holosporaceae bacterium]|jgi:ribosomal protein L29|nr:50S ribosomal protein L29 [Holosporaceae bacterium]
MAKKKLEKSLVDELESAKIEAMRIRFRKVLGESVSGHIIKNARKNIAKCVRSLKNKEGRDV